MDFRWISRGLVHNCHLLIGSWKFPVKINHQGSSLSYSQWRCSEVVRSNLPEICTVRPSKYPKNIKKRCFYPTVQIHFTIFWVVFGGSKYLHFVWRICPHFQLPPRCCQTQWSVRECLQSAAWFVSANKEIISKIMATLMTEIDFWATGSRKKALFCDLGVPHLSKSYTLTTCKWCSVDKRE